MSNDETDDIQALLDKYGEVKLLEHINKRQKTGVATIIVNNSLHNIPNEYILGKKIIFSHGNLSLTDPEALYLELQELGLTLIKKLSSLNLHKIYLIPTGHSVISCFVKSLVYSVTRLNTIDLIYSNGSYAYFEYDIRKMFLN